MGGGVGVGEQLGGGRQVLGGELEQVDLAPRAHILVVVRTAAVGRTRLLVHHTHSAVQAAHVVARMLGDLAVLAGEVVRTLALVALGRGQARAAVLADGGRGRIGARIVVELAVASGEGRVAAAHVAGGVLGERAGAAVLARVGGARIGGDLAQVALEVGQAAAREVGVDELVLGRVRADGDGRAGGVVVAGRARARIDAPLRAVLARAELGQARAVVAVVVVVVVVVVAD